MKKVAIVGSSESHWTPERRTKAVLKIVEILNSYALWYGDFSNPPCSYADVTLLSGGCPKGGIDIWAEIAADVLGIAKDIHYAGIKQWESTFADFGDTPGSSSARRLKGYKERNIEIATECDVLYCIDPKGRFGGGGLWTYAKAQELGKEVHHIIIDLESPMKNYELMVDAHWSYIDRLMRVYDLNPIEIGDAKKYYTNGMRMGYLAAEGYDGIDEALMDSIKRELSVANAFQFTSAYAHGFKHGKEDLEAGVFLL
jgi:hypothetical protein